MAAQTRKIPFPTKNDGTGKSPARRKKAFCLRCQVFFSGGGRKKKFKISTSHLSPCPPLTLQSHLAVPNRASGIGLEPTLGVFYVL